MRTTVNLDDDVAAAVQQRRRETGASLSEVLNQLVREALSKPAPRARHDHQTMPLGLRVDVRNIGDVLEILDTER
ncbi:MAG: ribbon-helix-helix protein, CopG family [Aldersonia sp.]|nr:ribbon-helix-helix protein, CopG family [Aldersonia sp.]